MMLAWLSWRGAGFWPLALMVAVLIAAAVLVFYPPQVRMLGRPWRWVVPLLRAAALGALAFSILRPVMIRARSVEEEGAVVVLMDQSMSMGVLDHAIGSSPDVRASAIGRLVSLSESLGRIPSGSRSQAAAELEQDLEHLRSLREEIARAQREAEYARMSGRDVKEPVSRREQAMAEFIAAAGRAQQHAAAISSRAAQVFGRLGKPDNDRERWLRGVEAMLEEAGRAATRSQDLVDEQLYELDSAVSDPCDRLSRMSRLRLSWEVLCGEGGLLHRLKRGTPVLAFAIGEEAVAMPLRVNGEVPATPPVSPQKVQSDLAGGLRRALRQVGKQPIQAVVLFSDGRQVGGERSIPTGLLPPGVPVFTVFAASPAVRDLSIERVELPSAVFVNETLLARVVGRASNMAMRKVSGDARLTVDDDVVVEGKVSTKDKTVEAELGVPLVQAGIRRIRIALPAQEEEVSLLNNEVERSVKVLTQRLRVTLIAGSPNWDYRYLRDALSRTAWVELHEGVVMPGVAGLGMTAAQLGQQDLVILSDVPREALAPDQWQAIADLVRQRGGSVIIIPGLSHVEQAAVHPLFDLMPYPRSVASKLAWRLWPGQSPYFHLAPAPGAQELGFLDLEDEPEASRRRWDELPGFYRYLSIPELIPGTRKLLIERESRLPILTERRAGNGRAFFFAENETWRWRARVGERDQDRFWLQLVRYAVDEPYALVSGPLSFDVERMVVAPGEQASVRARLALGPGTSAPAYLTMEVRRGEQVLTAIRLLPSQGGADGRYAARLPTLALGDYELRLSGPTGQGTVTQLTLPLKVEQSSEPEMEDLSGDREFLSRMAEATGGRLLTLDQVQSLPQLLAEARQRQPQESELPLWSSAYLFGFVLACLTVEWALRKRFGLA